MKSTAIWALVVLNAVLFGGLLSHYVVPNTAQAQQAQRRPGEYIIIPGEVTGSSTGLVYVVDVANREMTSVAYNENLKRLEAMPRIVLTDAFRTPAAPRTGRPMNNR